MVGVIGFFLFVAVVIIVGFLGTLFFKKTKFSDLILLMMLGLLIGPVFNVLGTESIVFLRSITPFFAALALMVLLFEGGLHLNFFSVLKELFRASFFTILIFLLSVFLIAGILVALGWNLLLAIMVGAILGGTSSAVIISLVNGSSVSEETKVLLTLESSITDVLCVIVTIALAEIMLAQNIEAQTVAQSLLGAFSIAAVLGVIFGLAWIRILRDESTVRPYQYILSVAVLFLLYSITEFAKGNGPFSALVFGLVLGNAPELTAFLRMRPYSVTDAIKNFQFEISLFVRTFFFVYLGLVFSVENFDWLLAGTAFLITIVLLLARWLGTRALQKMAPVFSPDKRVIYSLMARGLAAAVLATYPLTVGLADSNVEKIVPLAFMVILFSNIVSTLGLFQFEREKKKNVVLGNPIAFDGPVADSAPKP